MTKQISVRFLNASQTVTIAIEGQATRRIAVRDLTTHGLSPLMVREMTFILASLALTNPCGGQWVKAVDTYMCCTVGIHPAAALATRIWDAFGGVKHMSRSTRMDGTEASFAEAWA